MEKKGGGGLFGGCRWRVADRPDRVPASGLQAAHGFGDALAPAAVGEHRGQRDHVRAGAVGRTVPGAGPAGVPVGNRVAHAVVGLSTAQ